MCQTVYARLAGETVSRIEKLKELLSVLPILDSPRLKQPASVLSGVLSSAALSSCDEGAVHSATSSAVPVVQAAWRSLAGVAAVSVSVRDQNHHFFLLCFRPARSLTSCLAA